MFFPGLANVLCHFPLVVMSICMGFYSIFSWVGFGRKFTLVIGKVSDEKQREQKELRRIGITYLNIAMPFSFQILFRVILSMLLGMHMFTAITCDLCRSSFGTFLNLFPYVYIHEANWFDISWLEKCLTVFANTTLTLPVLCLPWLPLFECRFWR